MKIRSHAVKLFLAVFLFAPLTQAVTPVTITNPGFEGTYTFVSENNGTIYGYLAPGWVEDSAWANVTEHYTQDTGSNCHSGSACQRVDVSAVVSGNTAMSQSFSAQAGRIYTATVWMKGTAGSTAFLRLQRDAGPYLAFAESDEVPLTGGWQQYTVQGYVNQNTATSIVVGATVPGTFWVDDATVSYATGTVTPTPHIGPISKTYFGMHVADYLYGSLQDSSFEGPFTPTAGTAPNRITGMIAQPWVDNSDWGSGVVVDYEQDSALPHNGAASQKVTVGSVPSGSAIQLVQQVRVTAGKSYTMNVWLRGSGSVNVALQNAAAPYNTYASTTAALTSSWQKFSTSGVVGDSGQVLVMVQALTPATFWIDDAAVLDANGNAINGTTPWPVYSFGTLRLWDSATTWALLEPTKGAWNFAPLDTWVAAVKAHGNPDIIMTLGQTPTWASSNPTVLSYYGPGSAAPPANIQDWRDYITALGKRYKGSIRYYEIWNEPNDPNYYSGSVAELVTLTNEASAILKAIDPSIVILSPPPTTPGYLDSFLTAGGGAGVDVISAHFYDTPPEDSARLIANLRLVMARHQVTKPLWESEGATGDNTTSANVALGYMVRKYLTDLAFGVGRFGWYTWGPATSYCVGTEVTGKPQTLTATGVAYGQMVSWLTGANLNSATIDGQGNWQIGITLAAGNHGLIVWNPNSNVSFTPPSSLGAYEIKSLTGSVKQISGRSVAVTNNPELLVGR
jgi:hypothetical protein